MPTERRGCLRRQEDKDMLTSVLTKLISIQQDIKLLKAEDELLLFRVNEIGRKLGIEHGPE